VEADVLDGAHDSLTAFHPIIVAEHLKAGWDALVSVMAPFGYRMFGTPNNLVPLHPDDPTLNAIRMG
jgi:hypothetical protein